MRVVAILSGITFAPGTCIEKACVEALRIAKLLDVGIDFEFNGISVTAYSSDTVDNIRNRYWCNAEEIKCE